MSFKAWARANAPKAYMPPKQPSKSTGPVVSVEVEPTAEFQPGDHIHYVNTWGETRYGRFIRHEYETTYAYFGDTPAQSESNTLATSTSSRLVRRGWPGYSHNHDVEPVALANEFDEWDGF